MSQWKRVFIFDPLSIKEKVKPAQLQPEKKKNVLCRKWNAAVLVSLVSCSRVCWFLLLWPLPPRSSFPTKTLCHYTQNASIWVRSLQWRTKRMAVALSLSGYGLPALATLLFCPRICPSPEVPAWFRKACTPASRLAHPVDRSGRAWKPSPSLRDWSEINGCLKVP